MTKYISTAQRTSLALAGKTLALAPAVFIICCGCVPLSGCAQQVKAGRTPSAAGAGPDEDVFQPGRTWTLRECIDRALGRSAAVRVAGFEVDEAKDEIRISHAKNLPSINLELAPQLLDGSPVSAFSILGVQDPTEPAKNQAKWDSVFIGTLSLEYPVYKNGSILGINEPLTAAAARASARAEIEALPLIHQQSALETAQAYLIAQSAAVLDKWETRNVELLARRVKVLEAKLALALCLPADVANAQETLALTQRGIRFSQLTRGQAKMQLATMIKAKDAASFNLPAKPPRLAALPDMQGLLNQVRQRHPQKLQQVAVAESAKKNYDAARLRNYPTVDLAALYSQGSTLSSDVFRLDNKQLFQVFLSFNIPIFDSGLQRAETRKSRNKYLAETARVDAVEEAFVQSLRTTYQAIYETETLLTEQEKAVLTAKSAFDVAAARAALGADEELAAIDAELSLVEKRKLADLTRLSRALLYASLQNASGGVWTWFQ